MPRRCEGFVLFGENQLLLTKIRAKTHSDKFLRAGLQDELLRQTSVEHLIATLHIPEK